MHGVRTDFNLTSTQYSTTNTNDEIAKVLNVTRYMPGTEARNAGTLSYERNNRQLSVLSEK